VDGYDDAAHQSTEISNIEPANECDDSTHSGIVEHAMDRSPSPPLHSRLRTRNPSREPSVMLKRMAPTTKNREQPATKRARPVVFATNQHANKVKLKPVNPISRAQTYTIEDLFREAKTQATNVTPFVSRSSAFSTILANIKAVDRLVS
jgi:hypothetical protein